MNIFRFLGDISHLSAIIILLLKIWKSRSCAGISGKSQILFAIVFSSRYLDLFTNFISLYNTSMKLVYVASSYATVWMIYNKFKATYDGNHDTFRVEFLIVPTAILAFLVNHDFTPLEILWTFSIYLESVAILPQLFMVSKTGEAETITSHYLFALGVYRTLYLFNWIWRYQFEGFFDLIAIVAGIVQTILYCDFFYLYITKGEPELCRRPETWSPLSLMAVITSWSTLHCETYSLHLCHIHRLCSKGTVDADPTNGTTCISRNGHRCQPVPVERWWEFTFILILEIIPFLRQMCVLLSDLLYIYGTSR